MQQPLRHALLGMGVVVAMSLTACGTIGKSQAKYQIPTDTDPATLFRSLGQVHPFAEGDSPIMVVGGSITLRSSTAWANSTSCAAPNCYTIASADPSRIELERVDSHDIGVEASTAWTNIGKNWKISLWARAAGGIPAKTNGVFVCSKLTSGACDPTGSLAPAPGPVFIVSMNAANDSFSTVDGPLDNPDDTVNTTAAVAKRYRNLKVNGGAVCDPTTQLCEHLGFVDLTFGANTTNYKCHNGECRIYIGTRSAP